MCRDYCQGYWRFIQGIYWQRGKYGCTHCWSCPPKCWEYHLNHVLLFSSHLALLSKRIAPLPHTWPSFSCRILLSSSSTSMWASAFPQWERTSMRISWSRVSVSARKYGTYLTVLLETLPLSDNSYLLQIANMIRNVVDAFKKVSALHMCLPFNALLDGRALVIRIMKPSRRLCSGILYSREAWIGIKY